MRCGVTGATGDHIPFTIYDYILPIEGYGNIRDFIWGNVEEGEKFANALAEISRYMEKEYERYDNDILTLYGMGKIPDIHGVAYIFSDTRIEIRGEVFIVPVWYMDKHIASCFFIFRTIINTPFDICPVSTKESIAFYWKFCKEIQADIVELGLIRVDRQYEFKNIPKEYWPKNVYIHPIIFKYIENLDLQSFDDFMTKVEVIAQKYSLQSIGRRCKDFGNILK